MKSSAIISVLSQARLIVVEDTFDLVLLVFDLDTVGRNDKRCPNQEGDKDIKE